MEQQPQPQDPADLDRQTEARLQEIEQAEIKTQPLTSKLYPLAKLEEEYPQDEANNFLKGLKALQKDYSQIRMVRGDGNCFYRAFLWQLCEQIRRQHAADQTEGQRIVQWFKTTSWQQVLAAGYDEMTMETFHEVIVELLEGVLAEAQSSSEAAAAFDAEMNQEAGTSDYCTWYLRVVTATHLKRDPDRFLPFIETPGLDVPQFCQREVEPMGKECEMLQALALAEAVGVQVKIEYLDGHALVNGKVAQHVVGATDDPNALHLTLLYRPGHYDILYAKEEE